MFPSFVPIFIVFPASFTTAENPLDTIVPPIIFTVPLKFCTVALSVVTALKYADPEIVVVPPSLYIACLVPVAIILPPLIFRIPPGLLFIAPWDVEVVIVPFEIESVP